jgi:beta-alanine--pyruvate transaminase
VASTNSLDNFWMPFTVNRDFKAEPRLFTKGEGVYYWNHKGDRVLDGTAGLFCSALGHGRKEIIDAVYRQLQEMDYAPSFNSGHPISFEAAARVARITPDGMNKVFFANSGSEAVDSAMKIALAYHRARGEGQRFRFVSRERAYHGVNFGGVSLAGIMRNREAFGAGIPGVVHMRHTWDPKVRFHKGQPETGAELADDLQRFCDLYGASTIAACFVEPISGSTGILVPPKGYLERLRQICDRHGILLVFDEVICGFGRTGKAFGADAFGVVPDMMTLAKALTNAVQPMGAVVVKDEIHDTIVNNAPEGTIELFHGYTYSAHPGACAACVATQDIYVREKTFERAAAMSPYFLDAIYSLKDLPVLADIRGYGMIAAFEVKPGAAPGVRGYEIMKKLFNAGLHIKFTGDAGCVSPPLVIEKAQIDDMVAILRDVLGKYKNP